MAVVALGGAGWGTLQRRALGIGTQQMRRSSLFAGRRKSGHLGCCGSWGAGKARPPMRDGRARAWSQRLLEVLCPGSTWRALDVTPGTRQRHRMGHSSESPPMLGTTVSFSGSHPAVVAKALRDTPQGQAPVPELCPPLQTVVSPSTFPHSHQSQPNCKTKLLPLVLTWGPQAAQGSQGSGT